MEALPKSYTGKEFVVVEVDAHWKEAYWYLWQYVALYLKPTLALLTPTEHSAKCGLMPYASGLEPEPAHSRCESAPDPNSNDLRRTAVSNHVQSNDAEPGILSSASSRQPADAKQDPFETDILEHCFITTLSDHMLDVVIDWNAPGLCNAYIVQCESTDASKSPRPVASSVRINNFLMVPSPSRAKTHKNRVQNEDTCDRLANCGEPMIPLILRRYCFRRTRPPADGPNSDEEEEELEKLPASDKMRDPFYKTRVKNVINDTVFFGYVTDIGVGKLTSERLYRIAYDDGDLQHATIDQVKAMQLSKLDLWNGCRPNLGESSAANRDLESDASNPCQTPEPDPWSGYIEHNSSNQFV